MNAVLALYLLLAALPLQAGQRFFVSDELGLVLEEIGSYRRDEFPYVLRVEEGGQETVRTLFSSGREVKRWVITGGEERVYEGQLLTSRTLYDSAGRLVEEEQYREGQLDSRTHYAYSARHPSGAETFAADGSLLYRDTYTLSSRGGLREVKRTWPTGQSFTLALKEVSGRLIAEYQAYGGQEYGYRYNPSGKLESLQHWREGKLLQGERIRYGEESDSRVAAAEEVDYGQERKTIKRFDGQGRLIEQVVEKKGQREEELSFFWDEQGRKMRTVRKSREGLEEWRYGYDEAGGLQEEAQWKRGALVRRLLYAQEGPRVEELYRNGELFMRVYTREGKTIKEELIQDGQVVRVRDYGEQP